MPNSSVSSTAANDIQVDANEDQLKKETLLREQVLRRFIKVRRACVRDLMNELAPADPQALKTVIDRLLQDGMIRPLEENKNDPRKYTGERTVYTLVK